MTLYEDLGVSEDASAEELQQAYRERAREHHPDRTGQEDSSDFRKAQEAYDVLSKKDSRDDYDRSLEARRHPRQRVRSTRVVEVRPRNRNAVYEVRRTSNASHSSVEEEFDRLLRYFFGF